MLWAAAGIGVVGLVAWWVLRQRPPPSPPEADGGGESPALPDPPEPPKARKPVIYLYPTRAERVDVRVSPGGALSATWPPAPEGHWHVHAEPDGSLRVGERSLRYLFWEAEGAPFGLDPSASGVVAGREAGAWLEALAVSHGLTGPETADLVSYWLPELSAHAFVRVQLVSEAFDAWAPLVVEPSPDTLIRLFFVWAPCEGPAVARPLPLPPERRGFTVVEWGGARVEG